MHKTDKKTPASNRETIVAAAIEGFLSAGLHQTGVRDIAKRAGVSLGNLYNHFAGKDALIAEIANMETDEIKDRLNTLPTNGTALERLCSFFIGEMRAAADPINARLTADLTAEAMRNPKIAAVFAQNETRIHQAMMSLAQTALDAKEIASVDALPFLLCAAQGMGFDLALNEKSVADNHCHALENLVRKSLAA